MVHNVKQGIHVGVSLMGVGSAYYGVGADPRALSYVHCWRVLVVFGRWREPLALSCGASGFAAGPSVVGAGSEAAWRLDDMLLFGALGSAAAFIVLAASNNPAYGRYLTAGIIFGRSSGAGRRPGGPGLPVAQGRPAGCRVGLAAHRAVTWPTWRSTSTHRRPCRRQPCLRAGSNRTIFTRVSVTTGRRRS